MEVSVRKTLGDVYGGERITHAIMGILYGAMIASLIPVLVEWAALPTALVIRPADAPLMLRTALLLMAVGVLVSGLRDLYAAYELPHGAWPW